MYTKGKWKLTRQYLGDRYNIYIDDEPIAVGITEANAHLIASAPDLYEALKAIEKNASEYDGYQTMTLMLMGKALAKAEGK